MSKFISTKKGFELCCPIDVICLEDKFRSRYTQQLIQAVCNFFSIAWMITVSVLSEMFQEIYDVTVVWRKIKHTLCISLYQSKSEALIFQYNFAISIWDIVTRQLIFVNHLHFEIFFMEIFDFTNYQNCLKVKDLFSWIDSS